MACANLHAVRHSRCGGGQDHAFPEIRYSSSSIELNTLVTGFFQCG